MGALLFLFSCDQLFPQPMPPAPASDLGTDASSAGPVSGRVRGEVCVLQSLVDFTTCSLAHPHGPIDLLLIDTGARARTDDEGRFAIDVSHAPPLLGVLASDGRRQLASALVQMRVGGPASALPMLPVERLEQLRLLGVPLSPGRGILFGYVLDGQGGPLRGAVAALETPDGRHLGPYYEEGSEVLVAGPGRRTGPFGLVAAFELLPKTVKVTLSGSRENAYLLPVSASAITFTLLR